MKNNKGFTLVEMLVALLICSLIFAYLIPNLMKQYINLSELETTLEMKEMLYEELSNSEGEKFEVVRKNYRLRWFLSAQYSRCFRNRQ